MMRNRVEKALLNAFQYRSPAALTVPRNRLVTGAFLTTAPEAVCEALEPRVFEAREGVSYPHRFDERPDTQ